MKKKLYILTLSVAIACTLFGCGKKKEEATDTVDVKADVVEFVNTELPPVKANADQAVGIYNAYFAATEREDLATFKAQLQDTAIPTLETAIVDLNAIEVATDEVKELKALYLQGLQQEFEAMKMVVSAIDSENLDYLTQADTMIKDADASMTSYKNKLNEIATQQGIVVTQ